MLGKALTLAAAGNAAAAEPLFEISLYTGNGSTQTITNDLDLAGEGGLVWIKARSSTTGHRLVDTVRGATKSVASDNALGEATESTGLTSFNSTGFALGADSDYNSSGVTYTAWTVRKAPEFFDIVSYTGNSVNNRAIAHGLGVAPQMIIVKGRNFGGCPGYVQVTPFNPFRTLELNSNIPSQNNKFGSTAPNATNFYVSSNNDINETGRTYIAYLFATLDGVSKVGSYTGTGTTLSIDCGFSSGARFVLIKRAEEDFGTGDWYVWDTARGIVSGNDPYLLLNSTAAEVTSTDYIDPLSSGFQISSSAPAAINANGGSYIFLAIA